jgi:hypothetical protein
VTYRSIRIDDPFEPSRDVVHCCRGLYECSGHAITAGKRELLTISRNIGGVRKRRSKVKCVTLKSRANSVSIRERV